MSVALITGSGGLIGGAATNFFSGHFDHVVGIDNDMRRVFFGEDASTKWQTERLRATLRDHRIEAVIHMAADSLVGESVQKPDKYYRNNVAGSLNLLEVMRGHGVGKIVFSSSCATYGIPQAIPIPDDHGQARSTLTALRN